MKNRTHVVKSDTNTRALALCQLSTAADEQRLYVSPCNASANGIGIYSIKHRTMSPS